MDAGHITYSGTTALPYSVNKCEQPHILGGSMLEAAVEVDTEAATLAWLVTALEHAHQQDQTKVVEYLEEVADDVVFGVELAARRTRYA